MDRIALCTLFLFGLMRSISADEILLHTPSKSLNFFEEQAHTFTLMPDEAKTAQIVWNSLSLSSYRGMTNQHTSLTFFGAVKKFDAHQLGISFVTQQRVGLNNLMHNPTHYPLTNDSSGSPYTEYSYISGRYSFESPNKHSRVDIMLIGVHYDRNGLIESFTRANKQTFSRRQLDTGSFVPKLSDKMLLLSISIRF